MIAVCWGVAAGLGAFAGIRGDASHNPSLLGWSIAAIALGALGRAGGAAAVERLTASLGRATVTRVRRALVHRVLQRDGSAHQVTLLAARDVDALDEYVRQVVPATINAVLVPVTVAIMLVVADPLSALILALTVPLIPLFMALIGMHTESRVAAAAARLRALSDQLMELIRGLPVLVGLSRADDHTNVLRDASEQHRRATQGVLRTAFISSLALELIATVSVAVIAVTIGIRLVGEDLDLVTGLFVLLLAPECYAALRDVGTAFHATQDGLDAFDRADALIAASRSGAHEVAPQPSAHGSDGVRIGDARPPAGIALAATDVTVRYPHRARPALAALTCEFPVGSSTAVVGPSGSGKSTLLGLVSDALTNDALITGRVQRAEQKCAWMPQSTVTTESTAHAELIFAGASAVRANDLLARFELDHLADCAPAQLSPGELRRLAMARVMVLVANGASVAVLDEPTAHLDPSSRLLIDDAIGELAGSATVVVATHEASTAAACERSLTLEGADSRGDIAGMDADGVDLAADGSDAHASEPDEHSPAPQQPVHAQQPVSTPITPQFLAPGHRGPWSVLAHLIAPSRCRFALSVLLGALAALFAVALTAVSAWLIVRASEHAPIMYLTVAIIGVRFFGIGRSVARYAERLLSHDVAFSIATTVRVGLWRGLAARGAASRSVLSGETAVREVIILVDGLRDRLPRVVQPLGTGLAAAVLVGVTALVLDASLGVVICVAIAFALIAGGTLLWCTNARTTRARERAQGRLENRVVRTIAAADQLRVCGLRERAMDALDAASRQIHRLDRIQTHARAIALAVIVGTLCGTPAVLLGMSAAAPAPVPILAVLVLLPMAAIEPVLAAATAAGGIPALRSALLRVEALSRRPAPTVATRSADDAPAHQRVQRLTLHDVSVGWNRQQPILHGVCASAERGGGWLVLRGPSGCGKSTLLTMLQGYLTPSRGRWSLDARDASALEPAALRPHVVWCPQDAHVFDSTLLGNLSLPRPGGRVASEQRMLETLRTVELRQLTEMDAAALHTRVGAGGRALSRGERQRVAVARTLLTEADVVLLDEPTAHLDEPTARSLMLSLRAALADRIVVLVSHRDSDIRPGDHVLDLGRCAARANVES